MAEFPSQFERLVYSRKLPMTSQASRLGVIPLGVNNSAPIQPSYPPNPLRPALNSNKMFSVKPTRFAGRLTQSVIQRNIDRLDRINRVNLKMLSNTIIRTGT
jgi:hypothetical protein